MEGIFGDFFGFFWIFWDFLGILEVVGSFWGVWENWVGVGGSLGKEMREAVGFWRSAVWVGCEEHHRRHRQDVDRFLAGHQRVHEPALQQWAVAAGLRQERRGALPQGLWIPSSIGA